MSRAALLPLDSYRLAQYAEQCPCFVCEEGNSFDAELCRHCQAPLSLMHQAKQGTAPQLVAVVGSAGAGKTVFMGMLTDMLSRHHSDLQIMARGACSISLQQTTMSALARCQFPPKTPSEPDRWNWVHSRILSRQGKRTVELVMPDLAGESLDTEIDHPRSYPVIRSYLAKSAGVLVLIDAERLAMGEKDQDFFAMKVVTYLCGLNSDPKKGWPARPLSFVFTKADRCDACFENPTEFARTHTPGLWQLCQEQLRRYRFFAASVAGACAYLQSREGRRHVPLRIEPRGIVEPFSWLIHQLASAK